MEPSSPDLRNITEMNTYLRNDTAEQSALRKPVDDQPQIEGSEDAGRDQNIQHPNRQQAASETGEESASRSKAVIDLQQDQSGSAPQSPRTTYSEALEGNNPDQNSHSESGDTDFFTPEQSPSKLGFVGIQQQEQDNGDQSVQSLSQEPPHIRVQPASPEAITSTDDESDSEDDSEQGVSLRQPGTVESSRSLSLPLHPPPPRSSASMSPSDGEAEAGGAASNLFSHRSPATSGPELLPSPYPYSPTSELQADQQGEDHPASAAAQSEHRTVSLPLRLLLEPSEIQTPAVMSQPINNKPPAHGHHQNASAPVDNNQQAANPIMPQTSSMSPSRTAHGQASPQVNPASAAATTSRPVLTEEQVRALMMEDDDFDPIPAEYRQNPTSQYMPQVPPPSNTASGHASGFHPHNTQAYNTEAQQYQGGTQYMGSMYNGQGMYPPYQHGHPEYVGAYGYGFPQYYPGFNNPLFADPRLAYTPPVGPRAQMAGHLDTPPVGPPAQLAHPTGTVPYAQSPSGHVGVGGSPSRNRQGQSHSPQRVAGVTQGGVRGHGGFQTVNQGEGVSVAGNRPGSGAGHGHDTAGGQVEGEDADVDVVGGVALGPNGGNN